MRPLYLFLRITLPYVFSVYYKRRKTIGAQKKFNAQTIFVCNHPSAFIDPLVTASGQKPIVYFMVRSDIFKSWLRPVTWAAHMVPIYRTAEDGKGSKEKNKRVFLEVQKALYRKKSLLIFAEGYTDDIFIRSLKPIKKGAARIGFGAMKACNWEEDIKMQVSCLNYTSPKDFRSDLLLVFGDPIHLKEYKDLYEESPTRAITELTRRIAKEMQAHLTYIEDKSLAPFLENLLILSRKGMNHVHHDPSLSIESKFEYSRALSRRINVEFNEEVADWIELKETTDKYFQNLDAANIDEAIVHQYSQKKSIKSAKNWLILLVWLPIFLLGLIHALIPYVIIKNFVERTFQRPVFWNGVKVLLGAAFFSLYNLPIFWLFYDFVFPSYWLALLYFLYVPAATFIVAYEWVRLFKRTLELRRTDIKQLIPFVKQRGEILKKMYEMGL